MSDFTDFLSVVLGREWVRGRREKALREADQAQAELNNMLIEGIHRQTQESIEYDKEWPGKFQAIVEALEPLVTDELQEVSRHARAALALGDRAGYADVWHVWGQNRADDFSHLSVEAVLLWVQTPRYPPDAYGDQIAIAELLRVATKGYQEAALAMRDGDVGGGDAHLDTAEEYHRRFVEYVNSFKPPALSPTSAPTLPSASAIASAIEDRLTALEGLRRQGAISEDEYRAKRASILDQL